MSIIRSITAVLLGFLIIIFGGFAFQQLFGWQPFAEADSPLRVFASSLYTGLCGMTGGYVAAWIAPRNPAAHAVAVLAMTVSTVAVAAIAIGQVGGAALDPRVFELGMAAMFALIGGGLRAEQVKT